jgi:hypothetical protein
MRRVSILSRDGKAGTAPQFVLGFPIPAGFLADSRSLSAEYTIMVAVVAASASLQHFRQSGWSAYCTAEFAAVFVVEFRTFRNCTLEILKYPIGLLQHRR